VSQTIPLSPSGKRAVAAGMIHTATDNPLTVDAGTAVLLVDLLDALSAAVCDHAGLTRDASRSVLAVLWSDK
jgi:hypothetical protein